MVEWRGEGRGAIELGCDVEERESNGENGGRTSWEERDGDVELAKNNAVCTPTSKPYFNPRITVMTVRVHL